MAPGLHRPTRRSTHPPFHYLLRGGRFALLGLIAFLVACGGGGGSGGAPPAPQSHTVTASAGTGGTIDPTSATVTHGESTSFTVTPNEHYSISEVVGCGGTLSGNTYTTDSVTADCTVEASFVIDSYTVTATAGPGGGIEPANQEVDHGDTATFTVLPEEGYGISEVTGCGAEPDEGDTYTTGAITAPCEVEATFLPLVGIEDASVLEGDSGTTTMIFTVTLGAAADGNVSVHFATSSGTGNGIATGGASCDDAGVDYIEASDILTISAGSTSAEINVEVCGDTKFEPNETFTVTLSNVSANALLDVATATGTIVNDDAGGLNDTGITWCANAGKNDLPCPEEGFPGQDAEHGRDANPLTNDDSDGYAGFSYTKIGADGIQLEANDSDWACVLDNVTGLMWEVKVNDTGSLHHRSWTYTWYNSDSNGGDPGTENVVTNCYGSTGCDTEKFVEAVNEDGLCSFKDWRMPTRNELLSIVHNGLANPAIDEDYFPHTLYNLPFWSSVPRAANAAEAWTISLSNGQTGWRGKSDEALVRLVRGGQ